MKLTFTIIAVQTVLIAGAFAALAVPDGLWQPFYCEKLQVEWDVASNTLPATVAIYRVVPALFSPTAISNLVQLGSFTPRDRVRSFVLAVVYPKALAFKNSDETATLSIAPSLGTIEFSSEADSTAPLENVPTQTRAFELATNILNQLELPTGEFQTGGEYQPRAWFYPGTRGHRDKQTRKLIVEPCSMGIEFRRKLDNIPCDDERLHIEFESRERIRHLELHWHGVKPAKRCPVATKEQIMAWIKEGRARVFDAAVTGARGLSVCGIKRLTIKGMSLHYSPVTFYGEDGKERTVNRLYPYAVLDVEAELGPGDKEKFPLFCPVAAEGLNPTLRKSGGFAVFPSALHERRTKEEKDGQPN